MMGRKVSQVVRVAGVVAMMAGTAWAAAGVEEYAVDGVYGDERLEAWLRVNRLGITTADWVTVTLKAQAPAGTVLKLPAHERTMGNFRVVEARPGKPRLSADGARVEEEIMWRLEPTLAGFYRIAPLTVRGRPVASVGARVEGMATLKVTTPELRVEVRSVIPASEKAPGLRPLAPPVRTHRPWMPILLLVVLAPPCAALVLRLLKGRESRRGGAAGDGESTPDETALAALEGIEAGARGAERLNEIFFRYLQLRFHQPTRGRSIDELSRGMKLKGSARFTFERLGEQLQRARYGRAEFADRAAESARELFEEFVHQTAGKNTGQC